MIKKIRKIHYQSFNDYDASNIEFKKINLIYGLNGAGKSSFRKFLLNNKDNIPSIAECSQPEYEIFSYDEEYKRNTLYINDDSQNNFSSFYVGNEIRSIIEEKEKISQKIQKAQDRVEAIEKRLREEEGGKAKLKQDIAKESREILGLISPNKFKTPQSYTAKHIEDEDFKKAKILTQDELNQKQRYKMNEVPEPIDLFQFDKTKSLLNFVDNFINILKQTPENRAIERFKQDPQLENFAKTALEIKNKSKDYNEKCPLCEQNIMRIKLWEKLEEHFNAEYDKLIERLNRANDYFQTIDKELESFENWLNENLTQKIILDKAKDIDALRQKYLNLLKVMKGDIKHIFKTLEEKLKAPNNGEILLDINEENLKDNVKQILSDEIKNIIDIHNEKQKHYKTMIEEHITAIKQHFIAKEKDIFFNIQNEIKRYKRNIKGCDRYIKCCEMRIGELDKELEKLDKGFEQLKKDLKEYFSLEEIKFEPISPSQYKIQRQDCDGNWFECKSGLSEGEKTIVSLVYFVNYYLSKLQAKKCPIVIFDDPITSLDSRHRDLIKNYIVNKIIKQKQDWENDLGQFFIFSHDQRLVAKLDKEFKSEIERIRIAKNKFESHISKLEKLNKNDFAELLYEVKECAEGKSNNSRYLRDFLESIFDIVFSSEGKSENFTDKFNKLLAYLNVNAQYTSSDIQDLNHCSNEDLTPELSNKAKFVIEIFDKLVAKIKSESKS